MTRAAKSSDYSPPCDVLVAGGGNAGLCAALIASEHGANVIVLESAPRDFRSGNSRHTRNLRAMHDAPTAILTDTYSEKEYFNDLIRVTGGKTDEELAHIVIRESARCLEWMRGYGVRFQPSLSGTLHLSRTNAFFLGGGKALMNTYYKAAAHKNVRVIYNAEVVEINIRDGAFESLTALIDGEAVDFKARAFVAAAGGFESNIDWLKEIWGSAADNFIVRGTPYNKGKVLKLLLKKGAGEVGDASQCHAVAIDARAPKFDGGIVTRLDCVPLGIVVNTNGERFYDEGEDLWPKRYAIWGRLLAEQPDQTAWSIIDSQSMGLFMPSVFPPVSGQSISELAARTGLPADTLQLTINRFNEAVVPGRFDHTQLDDCRTIGLALEKTHWARPIIQPPFFGYPLRPGITFTYLGVKVDRKARVIMKEGHSTANILAAGEMMAGNILGQGYLAGIGMTIGTVFGRIAGKEAATIAAG